MVLGKQGGCLPYIIAVVATLSVRDPLLRDTSNLDNHRETEGNELEQEKADIELGKLQGKNEEGNLLDNGRIQAIHPLGNLYI